MDDRKLETHKLFGELCREDRHCQNESSPTAAKCHFKTKKYLVFGGTFPIDMPVLSNVTSRDTHTSDRNRIRNRDSTKTKSFSQTFPIDRPIVPPQKDTRQPVFSSLGRDLKCPKQFTTNKLIHRKPRNVTVRLLTDNGPEFSKTAHNSSYLTIFQNSSKPIVSCDETKATLGKTIALDKEKKDWDSLAWHCNSSRNNCHHIKSCIPINQLRIFQRSDHVHKD